MNDANRAKLLLLTGASRGLGRETARACAERGYRMALVARDASALEELAGELRERHGAQVFVFPADLSIDGAAGACAHEVIDAVGVPDVLINNAGIGRWRPFVEHEADEHDRIIDLNFRAVVHLTHAVLPGMIQRGSGQVINIASDLAVRPLGNMTVYAATKYALRGFSLSLSQEMRQHGIKVSLLNPGMIDTAFHGAGEGTLDEREALKPAPLSRLVLTLMEQPGHQMIDEVQVHAIGQDY